MPWMDLALAAVAVGVALALRPWRALPAGGPPWPWLAWWAALPLLWSADRVAAVPVAQPLSGAALLMLMAGWPLAVLALLPVAAVATLMGGLDPWDGLHRLVWTGLVPATGAMALGAAIRRWLPNHLFVYILGRGFFATAIAGSLAGLLSVGLHGAPAALAEADVALARFLAAWGDAFLTGMLVAIFVAFRPEWLATYADRIWLRPPAAGR
ncbi:MAG: energy-coupling factor ABC transporter permease [Rubrivivax sp.]